MSDFGLTEPPVDVEAVARQLGLTVSFTSLGSHVRGEVLRYDKTIEVEVNSHPHRQRFTIALLIGLYLLDHDNIDYNYANLSDNRVMRFVNHQASTFASELLMPQDWLTRYWRKFNNCDEMAKLFNVSPEAMFYSLEDLELLSLERRMK